MNLKNNKNHIVFPVLEEASDGFDREIIQIFLHRFRELYLTDNIARLKRAVQKTADLIGCPDAYVEKRLYQHGLRVEITR